MSPLRKTALVAGVLYLLTFVSIPSPFFLYAQVRNNPEYILGPGDVCRHPKGVPHGVEGIEESIVVEIKSPAPEIGSFLGM